MKCCFLRILTAWVLVVGGLTLANAAESDFELNTADGRRVRLRADGTWLYIDAQDKRKVEGSTPERELSLRIQRRIPSPRGCRFEVRLQNDLDYEVRSLVLHYSAYRPSGVLYDTVASGTAFNALKPGDYQSRQFEFAGIACDDIARVRVVGGDRCEMGELHRWSILAEVKGRCLARVRVVENELVRFDK
jgi:hypothetical protein